MKKYLFFVCTCTFYCQNSFSQVNFQADSVPHVFGPGIISDGLGNRDMAISPSSDLMLYTLQYRGGTFSAILTCKKTNGKWSDPEIAWFSGKYNDLEPSFSPDGKRIYFASTRPVKAGEKKNDYDIWYMNLDGTTWSEPVNAGTPINSEKDEFYPCATRSGNLYFTRENENTKDDIFMAKKQQDIFLPAEALSTAINSPGLDFNAYVDPDESFMLFSSYKRADDNGGGDLYVSLRKNGVWQPSRNLGKKINSASLDYSPFVSFDGQYFFFTSRRSMLTFPIETRKNLKQLHGYLTSYGNGDDDIYIMRFSELKKLFEQ